VTHRDGGRGQAPRQQGSGQTDDGGAAIDIVYNNLIAALQRRRADGRIPHVAIFPGAESARGCLAGLVLRLAKKFVMTNERML
jgi:hypothetical protein